MRFPRATEVQSILFEKSKWTKRDAVAWLKRHERKTPKPDSSGEYYRFRQVSPANFNRETFRTIPFGHAGIKAVIAMPKTKKTPRKKNAGSVRLPRRVVLLGRFVELEFDDKTRWAPRGFSVCASESGTTLWVLRVSGRVKKSDIHSPLYEAFHGYFVSGVKTAKVREPVSLLKSRPVKHIVYASNKWDGKMREYIHKFRAAPRAYTDSRENPSFIKLSGANIRVRSVGITG
jgi:hypothetical protein